jgi:hypothetical protein
MGMKLLVSMAEGRNGSVGVGGISWRMFAKGGETSYLGQRSTWVFPLSAQMARLLQTCSHIHHPFHSSLITLTGMMT